MDYCLYKYSHNYYSSVHCSGDCKNCGYNYHEPYGDIIKEWREKAKVNIPVLYKYDSFKRILTICTSRPGYMIGYHGVLIDEYKQKLIDAGMRINNIEFIECEGEFC